MGEAFINRRGGGVGSSLNFKVVAYKTEELLLADTPKKNTIGVVLAADFTNWVFSATEPVEPVDGMLWIILGHGGICEFDTLKKDNRILLHPIGAMFYTNGKFERFDAYIYQDEWIQFSFKRLVLFNNGDQAIDITGGWSNTDYDLSGFNTTTNSKVKIDTTIICSAVSGSTKDYGGLCGTANLINVEGFTKMIAKGKVTNYWAKSRFYVGVNTDKVVKVAPTAMIRLTADGSFEQEMELPADMKELYFFILACPYTSTTDTYTSKLTVTDIYLE